jgi:hypothetical protein
MQNVVFLMMLPKEPVPGINWPMARVTFKWFCTTTFKEDNILQLL